MADKSEPKWRVYEKAVAVLEAEYPGATVEHDKRVVGVISKVERQVDVWISGAVGAHAMSVAVECKCLARKVDIEDVESFLAKMDDLGAHKGVIVSESGFTSGAETRARNNPRFELKALTLDEMEDFDWTEFLVRDECGNPNCYYGSVEWAESGDLDGYETSSPDLGGVCRSCGTFNIRCGRCEEISIDVGGEVECPCERKWAVHYDREDDSLLGFSRIEGEGENNDDD